MSASWMLYATCVGLLLSVAALLLERPLSNRGGFTRAIWVMMLGCALLWPTAITALRDLGPGAPTPLVPSDATGAVGMSGTATLLLAPSVALPDVVPHGAGLDVIAHRLAVFSPLLLLAVFLVELVRIARARRRWQRSVVDGVRVLVSSDFGPAIIGVWQPQIVVPAWTLALPPDRRALMLAHETEHLAAHDSRWLGAAFLAVLIAPWNVGLWWLLRRFRLATEIDCDRRVLRRGFDVALYGELLLDIGRRNSGRSLLAAGFAVRRSTLRTRVEAMTAATSPRRGWQLVMGMALVATAFGLGPARGNPVVAAEVVPVQGHPVATPPVRSLVIPRHIRAILDRIPPPASASASIAVRFSRDTVRVGESVELVTATWFSRKLRDSLRRLPMVTEPSLIGALKTGDQQVPLPAGTKNVGGTPYDLYVSWRTIHLLHDGQVEATPAVLTYPGGGYNILSPEPHTTLRSTPAILIVRP